MKQLYTVLFVLVLIGLAADVVNLILVATHLNNDIFDFSFKQRMILTSPGVVFWIWSLVICYQKDKGSNNFPFLLIIPLYSVFYYRKVIKNKWLS